MPQPCRNCFFFNDTPPAEIYTLSLHDALPISRRRRTCSPSSILCARWQRVRSGQSLPFTPTRSEEHTSELQSQFHLVCRLLLEKKKEKGIRQVIQLHWARMSGAWPCPRRQRPV